MWRAWARLQRMRVSGEQVLNCGGDHPAWFRSCPRFKKEKEILTIMTETKTSYRDAAMKHSTAHPVRSYRDAAASKASQPMIDTATITKDTRLDSLRDLTVGDFLVIIARMLSADCRDAGSTSSAAPAEPPQFPEPPATPTLAPREEEDGWKVAQRNKRPRTSPLQGPSTDANVPARRENASQQHNALSAATESIRTSPSFGDLERQEAEKRAREAKRARLAEQARARASARPAESGKGQSASTASSPSQRMRVEPPPPSPPSGSKCPTQPPPPPTPPRPLGRGALAAAPSPQRSGRGPKRGPLLPPSASDEASRPPIRPPDRSRSSGPEFRIPGPPESPRSRAHDHF